MRQKKGTPRGSFASHFVAPRALRLGAMVFRIAVGAIAASVAVVARLFRQRGLFGRQVPNRTRLRHALRALDACMLLLRHSPHLLRPLSPTGRICADALQMIPWEAKSACASRPKRRKGARDVFDEMPKASPPNARAKNDDAIRRSLRRVRKPDISPADACQARLREQTTTNGASA